MNVRVRQSALSGEVIAPPSKSYTHRAIAIAALSKQSDIRYPLISSDTRATINAAQSMGAEVQVEPDAHRVTIRGTEGSPRTPADVLNAENSGTTLRFFTAIASLCAGATVLTGDASLRKRPNQPLLNSLNDLGAEAFSTKGDGTAPLVVRGRLKGGESVIDGSQSSQFISALLISCPLAERDTDIRAENLASVPYMRMTTEVLERAGVAVTPFREKTGRDYSFHLEGGRSYDLRTFTVPGDFSSASYILAAATLTNSEVKVRNLFPSAQGDARIIDLLGEMGAEIRWNKETGVVTVKGAREMRLKGITVDMRENPDLVPTIAVLATVAEGTTEITGVAHLRYKETDRLKLLTEELKKMGASIEEKEDGLVVRGREKGDLKGATVSSHEDHRMAMALTVAALTAIGETVVRGAECVDISYPTFFADMLALGADITVEKSP